MPLNKETKTLLLPCASGCYFVERSSPHQAPIAAPKETNFLSKYPDTSHHLWFPQSLEATPPRETMVLPPLDFFIIGTSIFSPYLMKWIVAKRFNFGFIRPKNLIPKKFGFCKLLPRIPMLFCQKSCFLWDMRFETISQLKNLKEHFGELSDELLKRIWSVYRYCINSVYVLYKDSFFFQMLIWEDSKKRR